MAKQKAMIKKAMRLEIIHVLQSLSLGGGERVAVDLAAAQVANGFNVRVISIEESTETLIAEQLSDLGIRGELVLKRPGFDPTLFVRLFPRFLRRGPTVVHSHNPLTLIYASAPARLAGAAVFHTKHGEAADLGRRVALRRGSAHACHAIVAVSEETAAFGLESGEVPKGKGVVITNGIDTDRFAPSPTDREEIRAELNITADTWVIGTAGRLATVKNQALLLEAAAPLLNEKCQLLIAGEGEERTNLEALTDKLPNGQFIRLLGVRKDLQRVVSALDCFAISSTTEGLPLVLLEAMACTLPIVSTAVGGIPDVVENGVNGFLVDKDDRDALTAKLKELRDDAALAKKMGEENRQKVIASYSRKRMAADYLNLYERHL
jgi:glycosyltransferase involved in cell wall biosynthesis